MGIETAIAAAGFAFSVVQQQRNAKSAKKQASLQRAALDKKFGAEEEQRAINNAQITAKAAEERRAAERERRQKVAIIQQQAENTGAGDSSGSIGAQGALNSGNAGRISNQQGQIVANRGVSVAQQAAAQAGVDFQLAALNNRPSQTIGAIGGALTAAAPLFKGKSFGDLFGSTPAAPTPNPHIR